MNLGLTQVGAISRGPALVIAAPVRRVTAQVQPASERAEAVRDVHPLKRTFEDPRGKIREQVLAERGLNLAKMMHMGPQARIEAEIEISGEVARRMGAKRMLDIRV